VTHSLSRTSSRVQGDALPRAHLVNYVIAGPNGRLHQRINVPLSILRMLRFLNIVLSVLPDTDYDVNQIDADEVDFPYICGANALVPSPSI
jgi:hypothetical protein